MVSALIDTGASNTCIAASVPNADIPPVGKRPMVSATGAEPVNQYIVDLVLPFSPPIGDEAIRRESEQRGDEEPPPAWAREMLAMLARQEEELKRLVKKLSDGGFDDSVVDHVSEVLPPLYISYMRDVHTAAGRGEEVLNDAADFSLTLSRCVLPEWVNPDRLACIQTTGDSMMPTLYRGDMIVLDRSQVEPIENQLFVLDTHDGAVVKRMRRTGRRWELVSDNPAYPPRRVGRDDRIVGRVAWSGPKTAS